MAPVLLLPEELPRQLRPPPAVARLTEVMIERWLMVLPKPPAAPPPSVVVTDGDSDRVGEVPRCRVVAEFIGEDCNW